MLAIAAKVAKDAADTKLKGKPNPEIIAKQNAERDLVKKIKEQVTAGKEGAGQQKLLLSALDDDDVQASDAVEIRT